MEHAGAEGDADIVIVRKTLELAEHQLSVTIIADDTDILLILLLYHANHASDISLATRWNTISIKTAQQAVGHGPCKCLLFVRAMSCCDTSALPGICNLKQLKLLQRAE